MWQALINNYFYYLLTTVVLFLIGRGILLLFNRKFQVLSIYSLSYSLFTGVFFISCIVSLWRTELNSINLVLLIFLFLLLGQLRNTQNFGSLLKRSELLLLLFSFSFIFLVFFIQHFGSAEVQVFPHKDDTNFYSEVSQFIYFTGQENIYNGQNILSDKFHGTVPYHYFDLWANAAISSGLNILNINSLVFVLYPFLAFLFYLSLCSAFQSYFKGWKLYLISITFLFFSGSIFSFLGGESFALSVSSFCTNVFNKPKLLSIYVILGFFFLEVHKGEYKKAFLLLLILPIIYVTTLPAILGAIFFIILFNKWIQLLDNSSYRFILVSTILFLILFVGFYYLTGNTKTKTGFLFFFPDLEGNVEWKLVLRRFFAFGKTFFSVILIYLPLLILLGSIKKIAGFFRNISNSEKVLLWVFCVSSICGMGIWSFTYYAPDSQQLLQNLFNPFLCIVLAFFFFKNWQNLYSRITYWFIFGLSIIYLAGGINLDLDKEKKEAVSQKFLLDISQFLKNNKEIPRVGAGIAHESEFKSLFDKNVLINRQGYYLKHLVDNISVISLNDPIIPLSDSTSVLSPGGYFAGKIEKSLIENGIYYNYFRANKKELKSNDVILESFLRSNNIGFLVLSRLAQEPSGIFNLVKKRFVDPVSGDRILFLNFNEGSKNQFEENHSSLLLFKNYFSLYIFILISLFLSGYALISFTRLFSGTSHLEIILFSLLSGLFFFALVASFVFTRFITVNILLIPLLFLIVTRINKEKFIQLNEGGVSAFQVLILFFFASTFFFLSFFRNTKEGDFKFYLKQSDNNFYSEVSGYLVKTGQENIYNAHNLISSDYWGTTAYHYFDQWFNGTISYVFQINNLKSFILIAFPILYFIFFIALLCLLKGEKESFLSTSFKGFFLMFLSGVILDIFEGTFMDAAIRVYFNNIFTRQKLAIVFILIATSLLLIRKNKFYLGILILYLIPVVYITTLPAVFGGIFLVLVTNKFHKLISIRENRILLLILGGLLVSLFFFYYVTGSSLNVSNKVLLFESELNDVRFLIKRFLAFAHPVFFSFLAYLPYLALIFYLLNISGVSPISSGSWKLIYLIFIATFVSGCGAWFISYYSPDAFQLSHNFSNPFLFLVLVLIIAYLSAKITVAKKIFVGSILSILILLNILETFFLVPLNLKNAPGGLQKLVSLNWYEPAEIVPSDEYLRELEVFFANHPNINKIGASIMDSSEYNGIDAKSALVNRAGYYLRYIDDGFSTVSISDYAIPISEESKFQIGKMAFEREIELSMREAFCFYRYVLKQKEAGEFTSISDSMLKFIKTNNIEFIILSPSSDIPSWMLPYIESTIRDRKTGEQFIYLDV